LRIQVGEQKLMYGQIPEAAVSYTRPVWLSGSGTPVQAQASVTLYLPSVELQVAESRKQLLLGMGGLFLLFGVILQRVLDLVLSKPFRKMTNTAQAGTLHCHASSG